MGQASNAMALRRVVPLISRPRLISLTLLFA
jgi:hypothetical protein